MNRWSEQIFGAHRDERETADLHERHAQMQEARAARKVAEERAAAADSDKPVSCWLCRAEWPLSVYACFKAICSGPRKPLLLAFHELTDKRTFDTLADLLGGLYRLGIGNNGTFIFRWR